MNIRGVYVGLSGLRALNRAGGRWLIALSVVFLTLPVMALANTPKHDLKQLEKTVAGFLQNHYRSANASKMTVTVNQLDRRLKLPQCQKDLRMSVNDPNNTGGNITVHTQCDGQQNWSLYVPAQVTLFRALAVASRNLNRGELIDAGDISMEVVNISQLRQGYLESREQIIGQELKRPINKGEAFRNAILDAPLVIKRGDEVAIEALAGSIAVTSSGTAMANGRIGQRIKVRNSQSDRIVSAQVMNAGKVQTTL